MISAWAIGWFALFAIASALVLPLYLAFVAANWQLVLAGPLLGYFASGIFSGFGPYLSLPETGGIELSQDFPRNSG